MKERVLARAKPGSEDQVGKEQAFQEAREDYFSERTRLLSDLTGKGFCAPRWTKPLSISGLYQAIEALPNGHMNSVPHPSSVANTNAVAGDKRSPSPAHLIQSKQGQKAGESSESHPNPFNIPDASHFFVPEGMDPRKLLTEEELEQLGLDPGF